MPVRMSTRCLRRLVFLLRTACFLSPVPHPSATRSSLQDTKTTPKELFRLSERSPKEETFYELNSLSSFLTRKRSSSRFQSCPIKGRDERRAKGPCSRYAGSCSITKRGTKMASGSRHLQSSLGFQLKRFKSTSGRSSLVSGTDSILYDSEKAT